MIQCNLKTHLAHEIRNDTMETDIKKWVNGNGKRPKIILKRTWIQRIQIPSRQCTKHESSRQSWGQHRHEAPWRHGRKLVHQWTCQSKPWGWTCKQKSHSSVVRKKRFSHFACARRLLRRIRYSVMPRRGLDFSASHELSTLFLTTKKFTSNSFVSNQDNDYSCIILGMLHCKQRSISNITHILFAGYRLLIW